MFDKLTENLNLLMYRAGITTKELSEKTGIKVSKINHLRSESSKTNPQMTTVFPICEFFSITPSQLVGAAPLDLDNQENKGTKVPIVAWDELHLKDKPGSISPTKFTYSTINEDQDCFALIVNHDNWIKFPKETVLIFSKKINPTNGSYILVISKKTKMPSLKKLIIEDNKYLKSLDDSIETIALSEEHKIIGVLLQSVTTVNFKTI